MARLIFDLDGTLVDSAPDIHAAANGMLAAEGLSPLSLETVISFIGNGLPDFVARVMAARGIDSGAYQRLQADVLARYEAMSAELTRPYPGVVAALEGFRADGIALGICTNKPHGAAVHLLQVLGLDRFFDVVIGGDSTPVKKPDPAPLVAAMEGLGAGPVLYVGDSEVDAGTAARAGVDFALFTEGYRKGPVADMRFRFCFADFAELPGIVGQFRENAG